MRKIIPAIILVLLVVSPVKAQDPWQMIDISRITFYGPDYVAGDITASGGRYAPDNGTVALGPGLLQKVRDHYNPSMWIGANSLLRYSQIGGCYPVFISASEIRWWGCLVRVCANDVCKVLRVTDTGKAELEVDLPDETWLEFGYPASRGVFTGTLEVLWIH